MKQRKNKASLRAIAWQSQTVQNGYAGSTPPYSPVQFRIIDVVFLFFKGINELPFGRLLRRILLAMTLNKETVRFVRSLSAQQTNEQTRDGPFYRLVRSVPT